MNPIRSRVYHYLLEYISRNSRYNLNFDIARILVERIYDFPDISIEQIAYLANTGPSSITKFCKVLGYSSFKEMRNDLEPFGNKPLLDDQRLKGCADHHVYFARFNEIENEITEQILNRINHNTVMAAAAEMRNAKTVGLLVANYNMNIMTQLSELLEIHGVISVAVNRHNDEETLLKATKKCDVILLASLTYQWVKDHEGYMNSVRDRIYVITHEEHEEFRTIHLNGYQRLFDSYYISQRYLITVFMLMNYYMDQMCFPKMENDSSFPGSQIQL